MPQELFEAGADVPLGVRVVRQGHRVAGPSFIATGRRAPTADVIANHVSQHVVEPSDDLLLVLHLAGTCPMCSINRNVRKAEQPAY